MKKLIALTFAMLFLGAGIASATDFTLSGSYYVRGSYLYNGWDNNPPLEDDSSFGGYDHELSVNATWQIDDTTKVFAKFEMADEWWGSGNNTINGDNGTLDADNNIYLEEVWGAHTFGSGGTLTVGKMGAGAWGTAFNDNGDEAYRIKYVQPIAIGALIGILEKGDYGDEGLKDNDESNDTDAYIVGLKTKAGDINVMPLFVYKQVGDTYDVYAVKLALTGEFGTLGFEAEADYAELDFEDSAVEGGATYGAYLNVWNTMDALTIGALAAWGSFDDDADSGQYFDFGDDFEAGGALIMGDDVTFSGGPDLSAATLFAVYADVAVDAKLSIGGYAGWAQSNVDDGSAYDGADMWEVSGDVSYAITDSLTYKVAAGYAQFDWDAYDADESWEVYNKLSFSF